MKRHKSLYPLSHDHHHALVQAKNLRIASFGSDITSLHRIATHFIAYWDTDLQTHFRQEEEILLPVFSQYSLRDCQEIIETLKQHVDIQQAVSQLRKNIEQETALAGESQKLSALLSMHIRYEEQHLFPAIQEIVPEEALWEINRHFTEK
ncbi:hemerythrin domain-containing protein [Nitrosomonas sp. Nm33]|uniref:hemerythrin domain-containing protein n=1 Tax=Nitrosomonas sp. Nm33 TaxID=133724 RepID=UPI000894E8AE|nr:hemerythrin domain-containing protein [Nitrosomonas sp. Nm33]SDY93811.1 Hemerythrin HHE cation binding domain-containing protein [Nitrosomonas sp. Nm33]